MTDSHNYSADTKNRSSTGRGVHHLVQIRRETKGSASVAAMQSHGTVLDLLYSGRNLDARPVGSYEIRFGIFQDLRASERTD
jgi:hypothetical protein